MEISKNNILNFEEKFLIKIPEKENDSLTVATKLLEKRREMHEIDEAFLFQKEEFKMKMESFQQRKHDLEKKELQLSESLLRFNKFLKENESKRNRAIQKAILERENQRNKAAEILELKDSLANFQKKQKKLKLKLEKYLLYQQYIENVIELSEEFSEIREIIDRFSTLNSTHEDLLERDRNNQMLLNEEKQSLMQLKENKNGQIIQYNNRQGQLQFELDRLQSITLEKAAEWNALISSEAQKALIYGKIKMATNNLYIISQKFLGNKIKNTKFVDTLKQLDKIRNFFQDISSIVNASEIIEE